MNCCQSLIGDKEDSLLLNESTYQQLKKSKFCRPEVTEVTYDINQLEGMIAGAINVVEKGFDMVWDKMMFNFHFNHLHEGYEAMERLIDEKNLKIRLIVEANPENIDQINSITNYDIRHLDDIRSNFGILDNRAYVVSIFHKGSTKPQQAFFSNSRMLIDKQQALFDQLWEIAIPLDVRSREIKLNKEEYAFKKTFNNIDEIQAEIIARLEHCKRELIIFSTMSILVHFTHFEAFWRDCTVLSKRNIGIKILTDEFIPRLLDKIHKLNKGLLREVIQIQNSSKLGNINECVLIVDGKLIFRIVNDKNNPSQFTGMLSSDSNQVLVQEILFEKYWNELHSLSNNMSTPK